MEHGDDTVRCLVLPIVGDQILVPNAIVAEVFAAESVTPLDDGPAWLIGRLPWRETTLLLVCMEAALGGASPETKPRSKIVVMNTLSNSGSLEHYAVLVQGIPHQVLATERTIELDRSVNGTRPFVAAELQVAGARAFIPDLDAIERALLDIVSEEEKFQ